MFRKAPYVENPWFFPWGPPNHIHESTLWACCDRPGFLLWSWRGWERKKPWWHRWFNIKHLIIHHQRDLSYLMFDIYLMVIWDLGYILQYVFKHEHLDNQRRFSSNSHSEWKANGFGVPKGTTMSYPNVRISGTTFVDNDNPFVFWGTKTIYQLFYKMFTRPHHATHIQYLILLRAQ